MTKIFITIPWFFPAFRAGGPVQSVANLVREFKEEVNYYIFCGNTDLNGAALEHIKIGEWIPYNDHTKVWYSEPKSISEGMVKQVEKIKPDVLYIIGMFSWHYNIVPLLFCKVPRKIISVRGMLHPGALSQKKWKKKIYLEAFKLLEYHHKIIFHATNEEESRYISKHFGKPAHFYVAGNFPNKIGVLPVALKVTGALQLLSIALISPMKNLLLVLMALEKVGASIQYDIYGPIKDYDYWEKCKEKIKTLPCNIQVIYHNEIAPQKLKGVLANAHVFILPSKSENFGHAIYEALSAGRPVITSNYTPWKRLEKAYAGINVSVERVDEMSKAIGFFAGMDAVEFSKWHNGAVNYAESAIDVESTGRGYAKMFLGD